jgi:methionine-rich copper-binding protein CopC
VRNARTVLRAALLAVPLAAAVALPGTALAHPGEGSVGPSTATPPPNATVIEAPERVTITFNAPLANVDGHGLTVTSPSGKTISEGNVVRQDDGTLAVDVGEFDEKGIYTVSYAALLQGHRSNGTYEFAYDGPTGSGFPTQLAAVGGGVVLLAGAGAVALRRQQRAAPGRI